MKYVTRSIYLLTIFFAVVACSKSDVNEIEEATDLNLKGAIENVVPDFYCNLDPVVFDLMAGQTMHAGIVTIVNDETNLYITYETTDGSMINEVHVYVGDKEGIPSTKKGIPIPGKFPYKAEGLNTNSYTVTIPLASIDEECPLILTHAALSNGETAWGWEDEDKNFTFAKFFNIKRWGYLGDYCIVECSDDKYFTMKFWYQNAEGEQKWGAIQAVDRFYFISAWCERMGVIHLTGDSTMNLIQYKTVIGEINIDMTEEALEVELDLDDDEIVVLRTYAFWGTLADLAAYGVCPSYPDFPYFFTDEEATSFEIPLE